LIKELEHLHPSGDPDVDQAWRHGIQTRFAATVAEQRQHQQLLAELDRDRQRTAPVNIGVLDLVPQQNIDLRRLPEDQQRRLYDAFHLELRYNSVRKELVIRVTVTAEIASAVAAALGTQSHDHSDTGPRAQRRSSGCFLCAARDSNPEPAD
jgi:hypothetical protein